MHRTLTAAEAAELAGLLEQLLADDEGLARFVDTTSGGGLRPAEVDELRARWQALHQRLAGPPAPLWQTNRYYAAITRNGTVHLDPPAEVWEDEDQTRWLAARDASQAIYVAWREGDISTSELAGEVWRLLLQDVAAKRLPWPLPPTFAALHDHVDANTYGLDVLGLYRPASTEPEVLWAVETQVDAWLRAGAQPA